MGDEIYLAKRYKDERSKLTEAVEKASTLFEIRKLFEQFSKKLTMIPKLWLYWIQLEQQQTYPDFTDQNMAVQLIKIRQKAASHFCHKDFLFAARYIDENFHRCDRWPKFDIFNALWENSEFWLSLKPLERALSFPHSLLKDCMRDYEILSDKPISPKLHQTFNKNVVIFNEITGKDISVYSYELDDVEFAIENIESNLALYPAEKPIWDFYFKFLKDKSQVIPLLNLYSRYCRLFVDDEEKRREYLEFIIELNNKNDEILDITKWLIDSIEIERIFGTPKNAYQIIKKNGQKKSKKFWKYSKWFKANFIFGAKEINIFVNAFHFLRSKILGANLPEEFYLNLKANEIDNWFNDRIISPMKTPAFVQRPFVQSFGMPFLIMDYIWNLATVEIKMKLQKTCKQIFLAKKILFCYKLECIQKQEYKEPQYVEESLQICPQDCKFEGLKNLWVTNLLKITCRTNPLICSNLLKRVDCSRIRYLVIFKQSFTVEEIIQLSSHQLKGIRLNRIKVIDSENKFLGFEDILALFPFPTEIRIIHDLFAEDSAQKLANLKQLNKLLDFYIGNVPPVFDLQAFIIFLENNANSDATTIRIKLGKDNAPNYHRVVQRELRQALSHLKIICYKQQ